MFCSSWFTFSTNIQWKTLPRNVGSFPLRLHIASATSTSMVVEAVGSLRGKTEGRESTRTWLLLVNHSTAGDSDECVNMLISCTVRVRVSCPWWGHHTDSGTARGHVPSNLCGHPTVTDMQVMSPFSTNHNHDLPLTLTYGCIDSGPLLSHCDVSRNNSGLTSGLHIFPPAAVCVRSLLFLFFFLIRLKHSSGGTHSGTRELPAMFSPPLSSGILWFVHLCIADFTFAYILGVCLLIEQVTNRKTHKYRYAKLWTAFVKQADVNVLDWIYKNIKSQSTPKNSSFLFVYLWLL